MHATDPSETAVEITRTVCENLGVEDRLTTEVQSADGPLGGAFMATLTPLCSSLHSPPSRALVMWLLHPRGVRFAPWRRPPLSRLWKL